MTSEETTTEQLPQVRGRRADQVSDIPSDGWRDVAGRVIKRFQTTRLFFSRPASPSSSFCP